MAMMEARLANKLRLSTFVLSGFMLLGSFAAYFKMVQVSRLSERVAAERIPALNAVRDLRVAELGASTIPQVLCAFRLRPGDGSAL
jgi:methyl-accepting chemotaxis protein